MAEGTDVFAALSNLMKRFGTSSQGLPAQKEIAKTDKLISFSLLDRDYVVSLPEINEILEVPKCTKLPRVKSWVVGVANVRGRLLPVIDFAEFLGRKLTGPARGRRVLVFEVATRVRASAVTEGIPIIMITSRTGDKHRQRAMELGVNLYMGKPYQEEQLLEAIETLLTVEQR